MLYSGQSGRCKQDRLVRLERTFVFQTNDFPALPAAYSFSLATVKTRLLTADCQCRKQVGNNNVEL